MENPTPMSESQPQRRSIRTVTPLSVPAIDGAGTLRLPLKQQALDALVRGALDEDGAFDDLTTIATVVSERRARASLVARENGIVCGVALALNAFRLLDPKVAIRIDAEDGMRASSLWAARWRRRHREHQRPVHDPQHVPVPWSVDERNVTRPG